MALVAKLIGNYIKRRLNGYIEVVNQVDPLGPTQLGEPKNVAVIGAGLAGIAAAALLAERGFAVTLLERNSYLGGKCGGWPVAFDDGSSAVIDHGFHAFFRHYYNLQAFLDKICARPFLKQIDDYLVLAQNGRSYGFKNVATVPLLNIVSLGRNKFYRFRDVLLNPASQLMGEFVKYEERATYAAWDRISYAEFAERAKLPPTLRLVFNTFARAFFAAGEKLSTAELIKSFHFFYLSHDHGLLYDYFTTDYDRALAQPVAAYLARHRVNVKLNCAVSAVERAGDRFVVDGTEFDAVILAADVCSSREIGRRSTWLRQVAPADYEALTGLQASSGYAVYRLWLDRQTDPGLPVFIITEKRRVLDSVTLYHRFDSAAKRWADETGGGVYELHCYALPEDCPDDETLKAAFRAELHSYFPMLKDARVVRQHLQVKRDFTAFHTGLHERRPSTTTRAANFFLAGDWVRIPTPAMLMEGAFTSGLFAANCLLAQHGLQEQPILSVPRRGLLARQPGPVRL